MKLYIMYKLKTQEDLIYLNEKANDINQYIALANTTIPTETNPIAVNFADTHWKDRKWQQCAELLSIAMIYLRDPNVTILEIGNTISGLTVKHHDAQELLTHGQQLLLEDDAKFSKSSKSKSKGSKKETKLQSSTMTQSIGGFEKSESKASFGTNSKVADALKASPYGPRKSTSNSRFLKKLPVAGSILSQHEQSLALLSAASTQMPANTADDASTSSSQLMANNLIQLDTHLYPLKKKKYIKYL
jgi:hypothetical protein